MVDASNENTKGNQNMHGEVFGRLGWIDCKKAPASDCRQKARKVGKFADCVQRPKTKGFTFSASAPLGYRTFRTSDYS